MIPDNWQRSRPFHDDCGASRQCRLSTLVSEFYEHASFVLSICLSTDRPVCLPIYGMFSKSEPPVFRDHPVGLWMSVRAGSGSPRWSLLQAG